MKNLLNTLSVMIIIMCFALYPVTPAKAQTPIVPGEKDSERKRLDNVGRIILEYLLTVDETTGEMTLELTLKPVLGDDNARLLIFDREWETRAFTREHSFTTTVGARTLLENIPKLRPFYDSNGVIELEQAFQHGYFAFQQEGKKNFTIDKDKLIDDHTIAFELYLYYGRGSKTLDRKLNPINVELKITEPAEEEPDIIADEPITVEDETDEEPEEEPEEEHTKIEPDTPTETEPKPTPAPDPEIERRKNCENELNRLSNQFNQLNNNFNAKQFPAAIRSIEQNIKSIEDKDISNLTEEESGALKEKLQEINREALIVANELGTVLRNFNTISDRVQRQINECPMFQERFVNIRNRIDDRIRIVSDRSAELTSLRNQLEKLEAKIDPDMFALRDLLRQEYGPEFDNMLPGFEDIDKRFNNLFDRFVNKRTTDWYFRWHKRSYASKLNNINNQIDDIYSDFASLEAEAKQAFIDSLGVSPSYTSETEANINKIRAVYEQLKDNIERMTEDLDRYVPKRNPWFLIIVSIIVLAILIFGVRIYVMALRRSRKQNQTPEKSKRPNELLETGNKKIGGLNITLNKQTTDGKTLLIQGKGLDHVYDKINREYFEIDLTDTWKDTVVRKVFIHRSCILDTYRFFYKTLSAEGKVLEYGGYVIGGWDYDKDQPDKFNVSLEEFVPPGDDAISSEYKLNFGGKIGVRYQNRIREIRGKTGMNFTLTAWFHSHPEINIFLSESDLIVQDKLANRDNKGVLLALVLDPNTQDNGKIAFYTGIFSYKSNHTMNNSYKNMQLIKWKDLYDWAKQPPLPDFSSSFCIDANRLANKSLISKIYISNTCIVNLSEAIESFQGNEQYGIFVAKTFNEGSSSGQQILLLDDLKLQQGKLANDTAKEVAYLVFLNKNTREIDKTIDHLEKQSTARLLIIHDDIDNTLLVLTKNSPGTFNRMHEITGAVSFDEVEAWPTRKR